MQQENYSGKKIEVGVSSSFAALRAFFEQMAHYQRIVSITNFELKQIEKQSPKQTVEARFDLTAFYVSAESLQKQSNPKAGCPSWSGSQHLRLPPSKRKEETMMHRTNKIRFTSAALVLGFALGMGTSDRCAGSGKSGC